MQVRKHPVKYFQSGLSLSGIICGELIAISEGDVEFLQEKWISILFHIQDKHGWTGHKFTKCAHQN